MRALSVTISLGVGVADLSLRGFFRSCVVTTTNEDELPEASSPFDSTLNFSPESDPGNLGVGLLTAGAAIFPPLLSLAASALSAPNVAVEGQLNPVEPLEPGILDFFAAAASVSASKPVGRAYG